MEYLAHLRESGETQSVLEHLEGTALLAQQFAEAFGSGVFGQCAGRLHDMGKYSAAFQERIRGKPIRTDHATAGAQEIAKTLPGIGKLVAYCVAGHHGGLPAGGSPSDTEAESTLEGRLKRAIEPCGDYFLENNPLAPLPALPLQPMGTGGFTMSFFIRMLYSCLVDGDFLDTEAFMSAQTVCRKGFDSLERLQEKLDIKLSQFGKSLRPIDEKRCDILRDCLAAAQRSRGLYTLTVPTGGGKTISSLAFALKHALKNKLDRILYVIPYTSIIEQNAHVFEEILGPENVLQHHSNFDFSAHDTEGIRDLQKLASENWDANLIVTTNVQFFESLFACKPSRCRKLHNIANSVIIFDEAQMFPTNYLTPCIRAISELVKNYRCTAVLCSATQPPLKFPDGITPNEICQDPMELYRFFRRTRLMDRGALSDEALLAELKDLSQVLCIVNTRKHARQLYKGLPKHGFHLSTLMCPIHRQKTITEIKRRLTYQEPCRVISTRLIEAGVDVDFPVVYRALAGVDSLVQSAGRCNREGRRDRSDVYIFSPENEDLSRLPHPMRRPIEVAKGMLSRYPDLLSPEAIRAYFSELYELESSQGLDTKGIVPALEEGVRSLHFDFPAIAGKFKMIEEDTVPILIPFDEKAEELLSQLRSQGPHRDLMRMLQPYTVSVYRNEWESLQNAGSVETVYEISVLLEDALYDMNTGLAIPSGTGRGFII